MSRRVNDDVAMVSLLRVTNLRWVRLSSGRLMRRRMASHEDRRGVRSLVWWLVQCSTVVRGCTVQSGAAVLCTGSHGPTSLRALVVS